MSKTCERCGRPERKAYDDEGKPYFETFDFCASCSKNLCTECMANGCCGAVPAASGFEVDDAVPWVQCRGGCGKITQNVEGVCFRRACKDKVSAVPKG